MRVCYRAFANTTKKRKPIEQREAKVRLCMYVLHIRGAIVFVSTRVHEVHATIEKCRQ
jgi:hypothetical protein